MRRGLLNLFFLAACLLVHSVASAQRSALVEVAVTPIECGNGPCLLIKYSNKSSAPLRTFKGAMPWADGVLGMQLFGYVGIENPFPLRQVYGVSGDYEEVEIAAGKEVFGELNLRDRFPELANEFRKRPIVIFWRYQPVTTELKSLPPLNGMVGFDRKD